MAKGKAETFADVAVLVGDYRKGGRDCLVIMPFYRNYKVLFEHLRLLSGQTVQDFDLMLVLSSVSDEKQVLDFIKKNGFRYGIAVAKRRDDTGSSGGFYTGERFAIENNYRRIIIADDDCLPADRRLIESLRAEHDKGSQIVYAAPEFHHGKDVLFKGRGVHFYSLLDISILKRAGLHFNRMYIGADDAEFGSRILRIAKPRFIDSRVLHPAWHSVFGDFERSLLYRTNHMLLAIPFFWYDYLYAFCVVFPAYMIFGIPRTRRGGRFMLKSVLLHRFGKAALLEKKAEPMGMPSPDVIVAPVPGDAGFFYDNRKESDLKQLFSLARTITRRKVLLHPVKNPALMASILLAKETWISALGGEYLLARNSNALFHAAKILLFAMLLPIFFIGGLATLLLNIVRKPDTWGYGLD